MANALADTLVTPPAPNPDAAQQSGNALSSSMGKSMPAPTHAQTVAALRHFQLIGKELEGLLLNPEIGKADIRSSIIDAVTRLVADRIIPPAQAVTQLSQVPDKPFLQKQAIEAMYRQTMQAEASVLDHHGMTNAPQSEDFATENSLNQSNPDNHQQLISEMMGSHYPNA